METHIASIKSRLGKGFSLVKLVKVGSFSRGTFVLGSSDVDLFAVISRDDVRWGDGYVSSNTTLNRLKAELAARFTNTRMRRDAQAIVVEFGRCRVDVVPAI